MGLFDKIKKAFSSKENTNVEKYEEGLTKIYLVLNILK